MKFISKETNNTDKYCPKKAGYGGAGENGGLRSTACRALAAPACWAVASLGDEYLKRPRSAEPPAAGGGLEMSLITQLGVKQPKMKENCVGNGLGDGRFIASAV